MSHHVTAIGSCVDGATILFTLPTKEKEKTNGETITRVFAQNRFTHQEVGKFEQVTDQFDLADVY